MTLWSAAAANFDDLCARAYTYIQKCKCKVI
jgi:hypothetical protein